MKAKPVNQLGDVCGDVAARAIAASVTMDAFWSIWHIHLQVHNIVGVRHGDVVETREFGPLTKYLEA